MPHDTKGNILTEGDLVEIVCKVKQVNTGETFCNVLLATVVNEPERDVDTSFWVNTKQVSKKEGNT